METRILIPIDHTEIEKEIITLADEWGQQTGAELYFVHATPMPPYSQYPSENKDDQLDEAQMEMRKEALERLREILETHKIQSKYQLIHRFGAPYWEITQVEEQIKPDCILIGDHSHNMVYRVFVGSNTDYVVKNSKTTVYVYKETAAQFNNQIIVPLDFTEINKSVAKLADEWALRTQAELCFIHVASDSEFELSKLENYVESLNVTSPSKIVLKHGKPYLKILEYQKETQAHLIMLAAHSHTLLERLLAGSNTNYLLHHAKCSLCIYKKNQ